MYKLRELERKDLEIVNLWRNDAVLINFFPATFRYINQEVDEKWFDNYMKSRENTVRCAIVSENCDKILGMVGLINIDRINQTANFFIQIGDAENRDKGLGTFATQQILRHAFLDLNLRRIELTVLAENTRAQHVYEKCGFVREGIMRQAVYKNGEFKDLYFYSVLKDEFCHIQKI